MYRINGIKFETKESVDAYLLTATHVDAYDCTSLTELTAPNATEVYAIGCTLLTELSAPNATEVYAIGCTSLTELSAPNATEVYAIGCTSLTTLSAPIATHVNARSCKALANCNGFTQLSSENCASNLKKVAELALASKDALEMNHVHACETTHCIAGWSVTNHPNGSEMEKRCGWWLAGKFLLGDEAASHFNDSQSDGLKYLKSINKE
jgi:hypothetical protein